MATVYDLDTLQRENERFRALVADLFCLSCGAPYRTEVHGERCPHAHVETWGHEWVSQRVLDITQKCCEHVAEINRLRAERDKLQAFKDWVHAYLDRHGVPHHPPGPHGAEGCRIGDRMDWLMGELHRAIEERGALKVELERREAEIKQSA